MLCSGPGPQRRGERVHQRPDGLRPARRLPARALRPRRGEDLDRVLPLLRGER